VHRVRSHYMNREGDFANGMIYRGHVEPRMWSHNAIFHRTDTAERNVHVLLYFQTAFLVKDAT
jgi:hypothetical protein